MRSFNPFNLISVPIPLLPNFGIRTRIGLSSEDPEGLRHQDMVFDVWLTVYSPEGKRVRRAKIDSLLPFERRFYDLTELVSEFGFQKPHLCVMHRIPKVYGVVSESTVSIEVEEKHVFDFDMYRTIVQLEHPKGGRGGVIYEIPHVFNAKGQGKLLVHSSQAIVGKDIDTYLLLLNYSTDESYSKAVSRGLALFDQNGKRVAHNRARVAPFGIDVVSIASLVGDPGEKPRQFSFVGTSNEGILIPLIVNVNNRVGSLNIEHTHSPHSYLCMPYKYLSEVRNAAIQHFESI